MTREDTNVVNVVSSGVQPALWKGLQRLEGLVPRKQYAASGRRLCLHCDQHALGDESHMLLECPATQAARAPYALLFPPGCTMLKFMRQPDTLAVAHCIIACLAALGD